MLLRCYALRMCGRFADPNLRSVGLDSSWLKIDPFAGWKRRYNVKPTQDVLLITPEGEPRVARWWLIPSWHQGTVADWKATTFNARIEDAAGKPAFRRVWSRGRCLMPVAGYYEWSGKKGAKQPHYFQPAGNEDVLFCAALASRWNDLLTVAMMTRAAISSVSDIHPRMPVVLNTDEREAWLAGSNDVATLGEGAQLRYHRVRKIGKDAEGPELIEPVS